MQFDPQAGIVNKDSSGSERRGRGRLPQESLQSDLGPVLDLSGGGMRVSTRKAFTKGEQVVIQLHDDTFCLQLKAKVAWIKKGGFLKKQEIGLQFVDLNEELTRALTKICTNHRMRRVC